MPFEKKHDSSYEEQVVGLFKQIQNPNPYGKQKVVDAEIVGNTYEDQLVSGFKNKFNAGNEKKLGDVKIGASDLNAIGGKLKGVPPLLLIGIVLMIVPFFAPRIWFAQPIGGILIVLAMFDRIIPEDKKKILKAKLKGLFKK
jgi:hypothetical protein